MSTLSVSSIVNNSWKNLEIWKGLKKLPALCAPSLFVVELACPLEKEKPEQTPAQKNFSTRPLKMTDYNKKRASKKTELTASRRLLGMPPQPESAESSEPGGPGAKGCGEKLGRHLGKTPGKAQPQPISIQPIGIGKNKSCLDCVC